MALYFSLALFAALIVGADQLVKVLVDAHIAPGGYVPVWDGVFHLTYTKNYGAAFSSFWGCRWLFVAIFILLSGLVVWAIVKKKLPFSRLELFCLAAVLAGGLGNVIDRVRLGYVVDMIAVDFMNFAVFNVADCFITCGAILLCLHLFFFNPTFRGTGKEPGHASDQ